LEDTDGDVIDVDFFTSTAPLDIDTDLGGKALVPAANVVTGVTAGQVGYVVTSFLDGVPAAAVPTAGKGRVFIEMIPNVEVRKTRISSLEI